jgi:hypothetical protein
MSVRIFDVLGRMIRVLANNEPCGHAGAGLYAARGSVVVAGKLR